MMMKHKKARRDIMASPLISVPQAADYLAVSVRTLWAMISAGKIKARRIGERCTRIERDELDAYIASAETIGGGR